MLLPAFSKLNYQKDHDVLKNVFQYSVKYSALIVVPVAVMVMALSQPAISTIFQSSYFQAPLFLALSAIVYIFAAGGSLSASNLINSQGDTRYNLKISIITVAIGFPLSFILISQFGIIGLIVTSIIVTFPGLFLTLRFIKRQYDVSVDWASSAKILFSSGVTGILTYLLVTWLPFSSPVQLVIGVVVFTVVFLLLAVVTRTIDRTDMVSIRQIVSGLGPLRKPIFAILSILEKFMPKSSSKPL
jgi:putative peptidoglycan lipid II flippase